VIACPPKNEKNNPQVKMREKEKAKAPRGLVNVGVSDALAIITDSPFRGRLVSESFTFLNLG
jgi:hypothetical protein